MITAIAVAKAAPATPYAQPMAIPVAVRRQAYRVAHRLLRVWWHVRRPALHGVKCVLTDGDQVLLVRHTYGRREWDFPGGTLRRGEAAQQAASREIEEELGIHIEGWQSLGDLLRMSYGCQDTLHCFQAEVTDPDLRLNRAEIQTARWFPEQRMPAAVGRHVQAILARVAAFRRPSDPDITRA